MKKMLMAVSGSVVFTMLCTSVVFAAFEMDGISLVNSPPYFYQADAILDRFIYDNVKWAAINVFLYQDTYDATDIYKDADLTPTDDALINSIQDAHQRGMEVFLKVNVDSKDEVWRGEFMPTNVTTWFVEYTAFMTQYAQLAQNYGVELFSVGCELRLLTRPANLSSWTSVINAIKSVYRGKLVYSANWWDEYDQVTFWNQLDYIGIDAYFPLDNDNNATVADILADWTNSSSTSNPGRNWFNEINTFRQAQGKDVIFTEIGYPSADGGAEQPWDWTLTPVNLQLQANCYEGTITFWSAYSWLKGMFFWESPLGISQGGSTDTTLILLNKPAEEVLRRKYVDGTYPPTFPSLFYPVNTIVTTAQPAFSWSYSTLPVYQQFDWESGGIMGWKPQSGGGSSGFAIPPAPAATNEQKYRGVKSMKCHLKLIQGDAQYDSGYMWVDLSEPIDFTNRTVSVALWLPDGLVALSAPNGIQFGVMDNSWRYADTTWQNITTGNSWIVYSAILPDDINYNDGADLSQIQHIGFKIGVGGIPGFQFDGYLYVDDFTFGSGSNVTYQIQVDDNQTFTLPLINQSTLTSIFYNPSSSFANGTYYWRVRANKGSGWESWSTTGTFTVAVPQSFLLWTK